MTGGRKSTGWPPFRGLCVVASMAAVMAVLTLVEWGCGGGNTGVVPLAGVWVANSGAGRGVPRVQHYTGGDFIFSGSFAFPPLPILNTPFVAPQDTLFDSGNNLWVVDGGTGTGTGAAVYKFLFNQVISLNTTSNPPPNFAIKALTGPVTFTFPQFAAFDTGGNLWVSDSGANAIFKFSAAQLASPSGVSLTPAAVLTNIAPPAVQAFTGPLGIAFDSPGNLWVVNNGGTTIVEITAAQLAAATGVTGVLTNTVLTSIVVPGGLPTINNPWGILFDANGNMWFTNEQLSVSACSGSVVEFASGTFAGPGPVTPSAKVTITQTALSGTLSLCDPNGITMNKNGDIVVANAAGNSLAQYTAAQITASGNLTPHTFVVGAATLLTAPTGLTFGPLALR
jgi:streptogramin lyase